MMLYALHDALVKPLPERAMASSLAESWSTSHDGLVYEFVLRKGATFHNGEPVTAEDVKFSRSEEHTSELQSQSNLVTRLLLEKKQNQRCMLTRCNIPSIDLCMRQRN